MDYLHKIYFGNSLWQYFTILGFIALCLFLIILFHKVVITRMKIRAKKTKNKFDDYFVEIIDRFIIPMLKVGTVYIGLHSLTLATWAKATLQNAFTVAITFYVLRIITRLIKIMLESFTKQSDDTTNKMKQFRGILLVVDMIIWSVGLIFLFDNFGYDVTAIITGLGIGGLAVALAAQTILGDLFSYFVVFFDKPFEIGDFIVVGDEKGDIEYIGIKTTRIKSLSGEQIIISNSDLTSSRLRNFKRMKKRRASFTLGVTYQTSLDQLKAIPSIINTIIEEESNAEVGRCHFSSYGDFSLNIEVVYYVTSREYDQYMDVQQSINLAVFEAFDRQGIQFAYPTQTVFMEKS